MKTLELLVVEETHEKPRRRISRLNQNQEKGQSITRKRKTWRTARREKDMTIKEFTQKAVQGNWKDVGSKNEGFKAYWIEGWLKANREYEMFLDCNAWQAVGKVSNWGTKMVMVDEKGHPKEWHFFDHCSNCGEIINDQEDGCPKGCETDNAYVPEWLYNMHRMIDVLAEGKMIEEFLATL